MSKDQPILFTSDTKPRMGRPRKDIRHKNIWQLNLSKSMREISRELGLTYNQVRYSVNQIGTR